MNKNIQTSELDPQTASATQKAYLAIQRMIVVGEISAGEKLKIGTLTAKLGTGASPVREALSLLTSDQLVERIDHRGFRAAQTSRENFEEILGLRCALEDRALRQSIARATNEWEERLVLSHHRMVRQRREDVEAFEALHKTFHMTLLDNCGSPILIRYCSQLYDLNIRYRYIAGQTVNYQSRDIAAEHQAILAAAVDRDVDLAAERLLNHYRQTGAFLNGVFSRMDPVDL
ncbi:MAG: GntR family transcriptional regulator [Roseibium sp.]|uniref:GntR family transcriptional regulator n=1 Tax=Roseibium sp. TaxID=1936156 RepID=UPI003263F9FD